MRGQGIQESLPSLAKNNLRTSKNVFPLAQAPLTYSLLLQFCELISNQYRKTIKRFRSDNETKIFNIAVNTYFSNRGIIHESSCVNTPQQNGLAERRLGYTLATARSLLFQAHMPNNYWGEAVMTAAHLINRMLMKVIGYESPINLLNVSFPSIKLSTGLAARIFGCTAFVHQKFGKLDLRALRCVFVGYSSTQKGYRCYHPTLHKFFVSAEVKLVERKLFFGIDTLPKNPSDGEGGMEFQFIYLPVSKLEQMSVHQDESHQDQAESKTSLTEGIGTETAEMVKTRETLDESFVDKSATLMSVPPEGVPNIIEISQANRDAPTVTEGNNPSHRK